MFFFPQAEARFAVEKAKAEDSQQLADNLIGQHYNEWVPHWVADGYERVRSGCTQDTCP